MADGLVRAHGLEGLGFFETAVLGLPCAAVGLAYLKWVAPRLLPDRASDAAEESRAREYLAELELTAASRLAGKTVEEAGLRLAVEVEVESLEAFETALGAGADWIMLDNLAPEVMREAAGRARARGGSRPRLEASGKLDKDIQDELMAALNEFKETFTP